MLCYWTSLIGLSIVSSIMWQHFDDWFSGAIILSLLGLTNITVGFYLNWSEAAGGFYYLKNSYFFVGDISLPIPKFFSSLQPSGNFLIFRTAPFLILLWFPRGDLGERHSENVGTKLLPSFKLLLREASKLESIWKFILWFEIILGRELKGWKLILLELFDDATVCLEVWTPSGILLGIRC